VNDRVFTNQLEASLNRGMASVPLPAVEPADARYRMAAPKVSRPTSRLTFAVAAVGLALLTGLAGSAASGPGPSILLSATVRQVVTMVEQLTSPREPAPATPTRDAEAQPAGGSDSSGSGHESVAAPGDLDRAAEPSEARSLEPIVEFEPVASAPEPSHQPIDEPKSAASPQGPPPEPPAEAPPAD
jgi:hypothetical protein